MTSKSAGRLALCLLLCLGVVWWMFKTGFRLKA